MSDKKFCPLKFFNKQSEYTETSNNLYCDESNCQWWVYTYTTEKKESQGCAIEILAMKNIDGHIVVYE